MWRHMTRALVAGILTHAALTGWSSHANAADNVLAEGPPVLTEDMVNRTVAFLEWALDAPFTVEQRGGLTEAIVEAWRSGVEEERNGVLETLAAAEQVGRLSEAERDLARSQIEAGVLDALRADPGDPTSRWLLRIYEAAHTPIVAGDPPLTRQVADAYAEVLCFMVNQVLSNGLEASADFKDGFAESLAAGYANYDGSVKQELAKMPMYWAAIRIVWPSLSAEDQEAYRRQWEPAVVQLVRPSGGEPPAPAATGDEVALASEDVAGYLGRAAQYFEKGQWALVMADCTRAIQLDSKCAVAYLTRAKAADAQFRHKEAIEDLTRAIELDPGNWEAYAERSFAYYADGQTERGDQDFATMRKLKGEQGPQAGETGDKVLDGLARIQAQHENYMMMSNMSMLSHDANMAIIHNLGSGWTYKYP